MCRKHKPTRSSCEFDGTLQLSTRGINISPARLPDESWNARGNQHVLEICYRLIFRCLEVHPGPEFQAIKLTFARSPRTSSDSSRACKVESLTPRNKTYSKVSFSRFLTGNSRAAAINFSSSISC